MLTCCTFDSSVINLTCSEQLQFSHTMLYIHVMEKRSSLLFRGVSGREKKV